MKLVFDIGATHTRLALTDGKALENIQRFDTVTSSNGIDVMLSKTSSYLSGVTVEAAIGGLPGQLDRQTGRLVHSMNLPGWTGRRFGRELQQHLGILCTVYNDVELVGLGEAIHGAGQGYPIVVYITVSSGVNGVRIVDRRIDPSRYGYEIGAQLVAGPAGRVCSWEELTGGVAMARQYGRQPRELRGQDAVWTQEARHVAFGLYNTILHWSPDVVVLGGSMMRDISLDDIDRELRAFPPVFGRWPVLRRSDLADDGGLYGAMEAAQS